MAIGFALMFIATKRWIYSNLEESMWYEIVRYGTSLVGAAFIFAGFYQLAEQGERIKKNKTDNNA